MAACYAREPQQHCKQLWAACQRHTRLVLMASNHSQKRQCENLSTQPIATPTGCQLSCLSTGFCFHMASIHRCKGTPSLSVIPPSRLPGEPSVRIGLLATSTTGISLLWHPLPRPLLICTCQARPLLCSGHDLGTGRLLGLHCLGQELLHLQQQQQQEPR